MKSLDNKELKEIIQSGHLNLLIGSGCSREYLNVLNDIETKMNSSEDSIKIHAQKEYFKEIKKSKAICNSISVLPNEEQSLNSTKQNYDGFLKFWANIISSRSLQIVSKQINIFTTNFDMFIEDSCERIGVPYNDGFSGQINRIFSVSNYNKIQKFKSLQFDNTSDIPLLNVIKLHGSISWEEKGKTLCYSNGSHILDTLDSLEIEEFKKEYEKIAIINPNAEKHFETLKDVNYASMLRKFTLELEKENSVLMIIGSSLADNHIRELLYGVIKTNPTLIVIYFSFSKYDTTLDKLEESKHSNLYVISPDPNYSLDKITEYLREVFKNHN